MAGRGRVVWFICLLLFPITGCRGQEEESERTVTDCAPDIDAAIREIELDRLEAWDFTAPVEKHGVLGRAYLVKVALLEPKRRQAAVFLLAHLKDRDLLWLLTAFAVDKDPLVRWRAIEGIQLLKGDAQSAIPFLEELATRAEWQEMHRKSLLTQTLLVIRKGVKKLEEVKKERREDPVPTHRPAPPLDQSHPPDHPPSGG